MGSLFSSASAAAAPAAAAPAAAAGAAVDGAVSADAAPPSAASRPADRVVAALEERPAKRARVQAGRPRRKRRKVAMFLAYVGADYHGMQVNDGVRTVEGELAAALARCGLIADPRREALQDVLWSRAARTDKGVSAASQCVSLRIPCELDARIDPDIVPALNHHLPDDIRVLDIVRATNGFTARSDCHRRLYEYLIPMRALVLPDAVDPAPQNASRDGDARVARFNAILAKYVGTHCFANFTDGIKSSDDASKRYMIRIEASQPFRPHGSTLDFTSVQFYGQSFVLHQIRRMCGLALAVYVGLLPPEAIDVALSPHCTLIAPTAPALGLLLDSLEFSIYNKQAGKSLAHPVCVAGAALEAKEHFKATMIYRQVAREEEALDSMGSWLRTLGTKFRYDRDQILSDYERFVRTSVGVEEARKRAVASQYPVTRGRAEFFGRDGVVLNEANAFLDRLLSAFVSRYGRDPKWVIRAPGRVNLIGYEVYSRVYASGTEHCDYNGFPVIGCATRQGTYIVVAPTLDLRVSVMHVDEQNYDSGHFETDATSVTMLTSNSQWVRYVSWGWSAALSSSSSGKKRKSGPGAALLVDGDLPRAVGLGSSSSLVTAAALAASRLNRTRLGREDLALIAAEGERVGAGTRGGAVDHTVSMCGVVGSAVHVSFTPKLKANTLRLPTGASFVVINSGVHAFKGQNDGTKRLFNTRVIECRVGAAIAARRLKTHLSSTVSTPGQLYNMELAGGNAQALEDVASRIAGVVDDEEEILPGSAATELGLEHGGKEWRNRFLLGTSIEEAAPLKIGRRLRHVFGEAKRVKQFKSLLEQDTNQDDASAKDTAAAECAREERLVRELGTILSSSHASLRDLYECSCPEVDTLVEYCMDHGAVGARITGAGWGGCILSLVPEVARKDFVNALQGRVGPSGVFVVEPSAGSAVLAV